MGVALFFEDMLKQYAEDAGIKIPENLENFDVYLYPHWTVYLKTHIGVPFESFQYTNNAEIIAKIPNDKITKITYIELVNLGCNFTFHQLD